MLAKLKNTFSSKDNKKPGGDAPPATLATSSVATARAVDTSTSSIAQSNEIVDDTVDKIDLRIRVLEKQKESHTEEAKAFLVKKDQEKAKACLVKKKRCDEQILGLMTKKDNLLTVQFTMQGQVMDREIQLVLTTMRKQMEAMQKEMSLESVEEEMERLQDAMEEAKEVSRLLSEPLNPNYQVELDEAEDDLAALQAEIDEDAKKKNAIQAPSVPSHDLPRTATHRGHGNTAQVEEGAEEDEDIEAELKKLALE